MIVLVHGAAITSLGLASPPGPRPGRAAGLRGAYVLVSVGWMILILVLFPRGPRDAVTMARPEPDLCLDQSVRGDGLSPGGRGLDLRQHDLLAARRRRGSRSLLRADPCELRPLPRPDLRVKHRAYRSTHLDIRPLAGSIATARVGPALPPWIFRGKQATVNPKGGRAARFTSRSICE